MTALLVCVLCFLSYRHTSDYKNSLTLEEYDATTSPNDPGPYKEISRMTLPKILITALHAPSHRSPARTGDQIQITKEELWHLLDSLRAQVAIHPHDPELLHAVAIAYFARGYAHSSEVNFLAASTLVPTDAVIPYNLGILYYSAHAAGNAERAWQKSLELDPTMGNAHANLSYWYYESGRYDAAWEHCQQAMHSGIEIPSHFIEELQRKRS